MLNCWIQCCLLAILSRFIYISSQWMFCRNSPSRCFLLFLPCLWFKTPSWLVFAVASKQSNHNCDLALVLVARESLWIPASMNGTFFMVSWRFWSTGTCVFLGGCIETGKRSGDHWVIKYSNGALILSTGSSLRWKFSKGMIWNSLSWCDVSV